MVRQNPFARAYMPACIAVAKKSALFSSSLMKCNERFFHVGQGRKGKTAAGTFSPAAACGAATGLRRLPQLTRSVAKGMEAKSRIPGMRFLRDTPPRAGLPPAAPGLMFRLLITRKADLAAAFRAVDDAGDFGKAPHHYRAKLGILR